MSEIQRPRNKKVFDNKKKIIFEKEHSPEHYLGQSALLKTISGGLPGTIFIGDNGDIYDYLKQKRNIIIKMNTIRNTIQSDHRDNLRNKIQSATWNNQRYSRQYQEGYPEQYSSGVTGIYIFCPDKTT